MYSGNNGHATFGFFLQHLANPESCWTIQTTCGFIKQHEIWVCDELIADAGSFPFSTRNAFQSKSTDFLVFAWIQLKTLYHHFCFFFYLSLWQITGPQFGCKAEALKWCHSFNQDIILHDKCSKFTKVTFIQWLAIYSHIFVDFSWWADIQSFTQYVEQTRLSRSAGAHYGYHFSRSRISTLIFQYLLQFRVLLIQENISLPFYFAYFQLQIQWTQLFQIDLWFHFS